VTGTGPVNNIYWSIKHANQIFCTSDLLPEANFQQQHAKVWAATAGSGLQVILQLIATAAICLAGIMFKNRITLQMLLSLEREPISVNAPFWSTFPLFL
jgi:hypothetical protein